MEEALDLSFDRLLMMTTVVIQIIHTRVLRAKHARASLTRKISMVLYLFHFADILDPLPRTTSRLHQAMFSSYFCTNM